MVAETASDGSISSTDSMILYVGKKNTKKALHQTLKICIMLDFLIVHWASVTDLYTGKPRDLA